MREWWRSQSERERRETLFLVIGVCLGVGSLAFVIGFNGAAAALRAAGPVNWLTVGLEGSNMVVGVACVAGGLWGLARLTAAAPEAGECPD